MRAVEVVTTDGRSLDTEQVIKNQNRTTIAKTSSDGSPLVHQATVDLPDADAAMDYQQKQLGKDLGSYDDKTNSCVTHVAEVLNAGGEAMPTVGQRAQDRYLRGKGFRSIRK
jgi:hypothetical protein